MRNHSLQRLRASCYWPASRKIDWTACLVLYWRILACVTRGVL